MDRANDAWIDELTQPGPRREAALADLRAGLLRGLRSALARRAGVDDAFLEDVAQDSLLKVLDHLDTFAGRGRFVSWAMAIAVRVALTTIRQRRWQGVSLDRFKD
jgi:RNA polymerase sigma-70 factor, ECF subfamily